MPSNSRTSPRLQAEEKKKREAEEKAAAKRLEEEKAKAETEAAKEAEEKAKADEAAAKAAEEKSKADEAAAKAAEEKAKADAAAAKAAEEKAAEDEATKAAQAATAEAVTPDGPTANINDILGDMQAGGGDEAADAMDEDKPEANGDGTASPPKKKKKKDKKKSKAKKDKSTEKEASTGEKRTRSGTASAPSSSLRSSRFSASKSGLASTAHKFAHERVIYEAQMTLKGEDAHTAFYKTVCALFENIALVDDMAILHAVDAGSKAKDIVRKQDVPSNITQLTEYFPVGANPKAFQKKKVYGDKNGNNRGRNDAPKMLDPTVYPTLVLSSEVDPEVIAARVVHEFGRHGGGFFRVKELQVTESETVFHFFFLYNYGHTDTLRAEMKLILNRALELLTDSFSLPEEYIGRALPDVTFRRGVPRLPGQDTKQFQKYTHEMQEARRTLNLEVGKSDAEFVRVLLRHAKKCKLIKELWGRWPHGTEPVTYESPKSDINRLVGFARDHTNYNCSMTSADLCGVVDINGSTPLPANGSNAPLNISLRAVLYKYVKLADGTTLFAEIHQESALGPVEVVHPNTSEAEAMVATINSHIGGFLYSYLTQAGATAGFVEALLRQSIDPQYWHDAPQCEWDDSARVLRRPSDGDDDDGPPDFSTQPFFKDVVGEMLAAQRASRPGAKTTNTTSQMRFNLDEERSVKTVHASNDANYTKDNDPEEVIDLSGQEAESAAKNATARTPTPDGSPNGADDDPSEDGSVSSGSSSDDDSDSSSSSSDASDASHSAKESVASG